MRRFHVHLVLLRVYGESGHDGEPAAVCGTSGTQCCGPVKTEPVAGWNRFMMPNRNPLLLLALALLAGCASSAGSQHQGHGAVETDGRLLVRFPDELRMHTISNMRDHLAALQEINLSLSRHEFDGAARVAEQRLGMSSLERHGAAHLAQLMPQSMQDIGTRMHRAASQLAVESQSASVTQDVRPALAALSAVMEQCVACHATFRLQ